MNYERPNNAVGRGRRRAALHNIHEDRACFCFHLFLLHLQRPSASYGRKEVRASYLESTLLQLPGLAFMDAAPCTFRLVCSPSESHLGLPGPAQYFLPSEDTVES